ncbi:MAG TPA: hypothetical protein ENH65_12700 [Candidatus Aminicenantes bacterium]|nr:hypothetical protein [Candidatus Aminicenantes bacterium]
MMTGFIPEAVHFLHALFLSLDRIDVEYVGNLSGTIEEYHEEEVVGHEKSSFIYFQRVTFTGLRACSKLEQSPFLFKLEHNP